MVKSKTESHSVVSNSLGFPGGSDGKESVCHMGGPGSIPESGGSPGEGYGNPLQCSCLENPMDPGCHALSRGPSGLRTEPGSPALQADSLLPEPPGKSIVL